jgi:hypothetical protein
MSSKADKVDQANKHHDKTSDSDFLVGEELEPEHMELNDLRGPGVLRTRNVERGCASEVCFIGLTAFGLVLILTFFIVIIILYSKKVNEEN